MPGSGKSYFAENATKSLPFVVVDYEKIRSVMTDSPKYDKTENKNVHKMAEYLASEYLQNNMSVIMDTNAYNFALRKRMNELAKNHKAKSMMIWFQIDTDSAFTRTLTRGKRTTQRKLTHRLDRTSFEDYIKTMQHPEPKENYLVLSGKHSWPMQRAGLLRKLYDLNLITSEELASNIVKPGLMNLVPSRDSSQNLRKSININ